MTQRWIRPFSWQGCRVPHSDSPTVVVTGAAGGIGRAILERFAVRGTRLIAADVDSSALAKVCDGLNKGTEVATAVAGDLRDKAYCESLIEAAVVRTGRLDVLVNNAGTISRGNILETTDEDWFRLLDINLTAVFYTCRAAIRHMRTHGGGAIVNIASTWGIYPGPEHPAYCTSKSAVATLSKCLGRDHAGDGIRVNAICPNEVNTPMLRSGFRKRGFDPDRAIEQLNQTVPLGRIAEPEDIADVVVFLASREARYIAGAAVEVSGAKAVY